MQFSASKSRLDQPWIVLKISWKGIENPERGKVYYHYDSTTIMTTIAKDVSCFIENLDGSMTEIFQKLNVAVPFLSRLPPDSKDKLQIERELWDRVCKALRKCGSGGFMLCFAITVPFGSVQYPFAIIKDARALEIDPLFSPINQHPRLTTVLPTDAASLCCPICLDKLFGEESAVEWLPCAHCFHHGCINSWLKSNWTCPVCRLSIEIDT
ncbi:uncharacterized protein LOC109727756 [Ananas comosus]|uniref:Uncharacterized protein LOC109727756 n=1 Tax=Ananas comosus TaxID=4615 RepID=A0A6P5GXY6_ANACO|nr:uncharacterized protein LOC109727756 [Ananas comosus]